LVASALAVRTVVVAVAIGADRDGTPASDGFWAVRVTPGMGAGAGAARSGLDCTNMTTQRTRQIILENLLVG
jgi:hypothetical protein